MSTVYQHQLHAHKTRRKHPWRWAVAIVLVLTGGAIYGFTLLKPETTISKSKPVTVKQESTAAATKSFQKGVFTISLPKDWQFMSKETNLYTIYHFKGTGAENGNRSLDIYEDSTLPNFAVNRMVPITPNENGGLTTDASLVSDNCDAYTSGSNSGRQTVGQIAKWQGIEFICDKGNTLRNVVGTGSTSGLNTVNLKTPTSRQHQYFFAYTDNNIKPDYNIFTNALNSFKLIE